MFPSISNDSNEALDNELPHFPEPYDCSMYRRLYLASVGIQERLRLTQRLYDRLFLPSMLPSFVRSSSVPPKLFTPNASQQTAREMFPLRLPFIARRSLFLRLFNGEEGSFFVPRCLHFFSAIRLRQEGKPRVVVVGKPARQRVLPLVPHGIPSALAVIWNDASEQARRLFTPCFILQIASSTFLSSILERICFPKRFPPRPWRRRRCRRRRARHFTLSPNGGELVGEGPTSTRLHRVTRSSISATLNVSPLHICPLKVSSCCRYISPA